MFLTLNALVFTLCLANPIHSYMTSKAADEQSRAEAETPYLWVGPLRINLPTGNGDWVGFICLIGFRVPLSIETQKPPLTACAPLGPSTGPPTTEQGEKVPGKGA